MGRGLINSFEIEFKSASRNLKSAILLCAMLFALCAAADAQQPTKVPRIAYLSANFSSAIAERTEAFRQGLRELGYVEGKNILIEYRYAEGKVEHLPTLVAELVRLKVDVIVTAGPASTRPAKEATVTIPIVMTQVNDPVAMGLSPASRDRAGTLPDWQLLPRR